MPRIVRNSALLPQPDSPITARTRPRWRENDTSFTARSGPACVLNSVVSPRTSSSGCCVLVAVLAWTSTDVVMRWPPSPVAAPKFPVLASPLAHGPLGGGRAAEVCPPLYRAMRYVSRRSVKTKLLQRARHVVLVHGRRVWQRLGCARGVEAQPLVERNRWPVRCGDVEVEHIGAALPGPASEDAEQGLCRPLPADGGIHPHAKYPGRPLASAPFLQHAGANADPYAVALRDEGGPVVIRSATGGAAARACSRIVRSRSHSSAQTRRTVISACMLSFLRPVAARPVSTGGRTS